MNLGSLIPFRSSTPERAGATDPFSAMRREMERLFDDFGRSWSLPANFGNNGFLNPKVDISETPSGLEMVAELPGIAEKDIDLEIDDNVLTLKAEHSSERQDKDEKRKYHLVERTHGTFLRRFQLPFAVDEDKVSAKFQNGVLNVVIPRAAAAEKPTRKIAVTKA